MQKPIQSDFLNTVVARAALEWPVGEWASSPVIVAVSGGADSVALLRILTLLKDRAIDQGSVDADAGSLIVVHCNHGVRSQNDSDAEFVRRLASELGHEYECANRVSSSTHAKDCEDSQLQSEETLRNFRYASLADIAKRFGARYIVTGHTKDDQVETVLFRVIRGTGISGLTGIPRIRVAGDVSTVRPLLSTWRSEILQLLNELDQSYVVDDSNSDSQYSRNFLRNETLPSLQKRFGEQVSQSLLRLADHATELQGFLEHLCEPFVANLIVEYGKTAKLPIDNLRSVHPVLLAEVVRSVWRRAGFSEQGMSRQNWQQLSGLVVANSGAVQLPGSIEARIELGQLVVRRLDDKK